MKQRCYNPNNSHYKWYGEKGVTICDEWMGDNGLQNFILWSLEHGYNENLTIDRIDSNQGYYPGNCQWVTHSINSQKVLNESIISQLNQASGHFIYKSTEQLIIELKKSCSKSKSARKMLLKN